MGTYTGKALYRVLSRLARVLTHQALGSFRMPSAKTFSHNRTRERRTLKARQNSGILAIQNRNIHTTESEFAYGDTEDEKVVLTQSDAAELLGLLERISGITRLKIKLYCLIEARYMILEGL